MPPSGPLQAFSVPNTIPVMAAGTVYSIIFRYLNPQGMVSRHPWDVVSTENWAAKPVFQISLAIDCPITYRAIRIQVVLK